jgi:CBS-domain-containing membrane protein
MYAETAATHKVETCGASATILQVADLMHSLHVGDLVVVEYRQEKPVPIGIITDRDLVVKVLALRIDPSAITVGDVMSRKLVTVKVGEQLETAIERMRGSGVRRVPLVDAEGVLVGIVTLDDIVEKFSFAIADISRVSHLQIVDEKMMRQ